MNAILLLCFILNISLCFAANAWEPQAKDATWMTHHNTLVTQTKTHGKEIKVAFLGDSITEGWSWWGKAVWAKNYAPRGAYNYGIAGDTTQNVLYRIQNHEFDGMSPKFVVLMIGTNNIGWDTEANVAHGIKEIVNQLLMKLPTSKILLLAMLPRSEANLNTKVHKANSIIAALGDNSKVFYLDMASHFEKNNIEIPGLYVEGLHIQEKGYQVWYETMEPTFAKLLNM